MTLSVTVVLCMTVPSVSVTVRVYILGAAVPALTFKVELLPAVTEVGFKEALAPVGTPVTTRPMVPAVPAVTAVEMVLESLPPCAIVRLEGEALILKSLTTAKFAVTLCGPLIVTVVLAEFGSATLPVQLLNEYPELGEALIGTTAFAA